MGNSAAGKTALLDRLINDKFEARYTPTSGIVVNVHPFAYESMQLQLELWDTCGDDRFDTLAPIFFHGVQGVILVYDSTSNESF